MTENMKHLSLRLPPDIYDYLRTSATAERLPLHTLIIRILDAQMKQAQHRINGVIQDV